jgi:hypothetical protein
MTEPTTARCTCHPVPEHLHTTHYGATEPGSTLEPDYDCPVHFAESECPCAACDPGLIIDGQPIGLASRMSVCPDCGNKRCPKAANHARWECSGSNETGQVGVLIDATST